MALIAGLLGPAPSLPMSPMMNPHLQLGLITMLVLHIHAEKKEPVSVCVCVLMLHIIAEKKETGLCVYVCVCTNAANHR